LGYSLSPRPGFLFNMARSHFRLGQYARARELFQQFLDLTPATPGLPDRAEAEQNIAQIVREHPEALPIPEPAATARRPAATVATPAAVERRAPRRRWVWPLVGSAIAVAAAVVAVVLVITLSVDYGARESASCSPPGCVLFGGLK